MCLQYPPDDLATKWEIARPEIEQRLTKLTACCTAREIPDATLTANFIAVGFPNGVPERCALLTIVKENGTVYWSYDNGTSWTLIYDGSAQQQLFPTGSISNYSGLISEIPALWLVCDGTAVSRATYALLFERIGTTYGAGDGLTTFNLPDMRGRAFMGANYVTLPNNNNGSFTTRNRGVDVGAETHVLANTENPTHNHGTAYPQGSVAAGGTGSGTNFSNRNQVVSGTQGNGDAHNNMQPYIVDLFIIKS